jgi:hypothetical protein
MKLPAVFSWPRQKAHSPYRALLLAAGLLALALGGALWSWESLQHETDLARGAQANVQRARQAVLKIHAYRPVLLTEDPGAALGTWLDAALRQGHVDAQALRTRSVRSLGPVGETGVVRSQAHLEWAGLSPPQVAGILAALETTNVPLSVDEAKLIPDGSQGWNLTLDLGYLQKPAARSTTP